MDLWVRPLRRAAGIGYGWYGRYGMYGPYGAAPNAGTVKLIRTSQMQRSSLMAFTKEPLGK
jgi:hypothetical protein